LAFVTQSDIAVVQGINKKGNKQKKEESKLLGIFDPLGAKLA
jgi:hypothetical protein